MTISWHKKRRHNHVHPFAGHSLQLLLAVRFTMSTTYTGHCDCQLRHRHITVRKCQQLLPTTWRRFGMSTTNTGHNRTSVLLRGQMGNEAMKLLKTFTLGARKTFGKQSLLISPNITAQSSLSSHLIQLCVCSHPNY